MTQNGRLIVVVGCGFVGSIFTTEFLKWAFAGTLAVRFRFIDDDIFDTRNAANQNCLPCDAGKSKAKVMQDLAIRSGHNAEAHEVRLDAETAHLLDDAWIIIDGVDNVATRQFLWYQGMARSVPVLHVGLAEDGSGKVEWSHPEHDTFGLSPLRTVGKTLVDPKSGVTPPCELARMRGAGLNIGFAAAKAAALYLGFDPESQLEGEKSDGWLSVWQGTPASHFAVRELWSRVAPPPVSEAAESGVAPADVANAPAEDTPVEIVGDVAPTDEDRETLLAAV